MIKTITALVSLLS